MDSATLLARITDDASRPNPYPLYAELREAGPVVPQADGSYLIGTYHEIAALIHDPRMSVDPRCRGEVTHKPPFLRLDDPEHHRLRTLAMRPFGPPHSPGRIDAMRDEIDRITKELLEPFEAGRQIDVVDDFAYPLPVTVICRLLGVPREDEPLFRAWSDALVAAADVRPEADTTETDKAGDQARIEMGGYLVNLAEQRRGRPGDDMLSAFVNEPDPALRLTQEELAETAVLLLIAGHETTVNLIANGVLTLLRQPEHLDRLRRDDADLMPRAVEELLRYEPPVHMRERIPRADIEVAGTRIPKGTSVLMVLASGNRDPMRFHEPDRFDPTRPDNEHLGFGSGIHFCYGAPLARLEAQAALRALLPHLGTARLVQDPPPYRRNAMLRGPRHLPLQL
ncbi:cytochrome P450 [Streptomyces sp. NPDC051452]|uniref:cytochrome P450 n=1 Tax=Streptomyces sp. NPDC051452 TaxID=3365654 RepID=UPI0037A6F6A7